MKNFVLCVCSLFLGLFTFNLYSQQDVEPSKLYSAGDVIFSPTYGIEMQMPPNWTGYLTRETVVFTLKCDTLNDVVVYIYPTNNDIERVKNRWNAGVELRPGVVVKPTESLVIEDEKVEGALRAEGNKAVKAFIYSVKGDLESGYTMILSYALNKGEAYKPILGLLAPQITFGKPRSPEELEWSQFLSGKYVYSYKLTNNSSRTNQIWLCKDGTFRSILKKRGLDKKINKQYQGQKTGTYKLTGIGSQGKLNLTFKKLDPVEVNLELRGEMLYVNGQRFFFNNENQCK